jgi:hypothetical protein
MQRPFDNADRSRCYGLRVGDIVSPKIPNGKEFYKGQAEVIELALLDNNKVYLRFNDGSEIDWVAEWCDIITKVEDRQNGEI